MSDIEEQLDAWEELKAKARGATPKGGRPAAALSLPSRHTPARLPTTVVYDTINLQVDHGSWDTVIYRPPPPTVIYRPPPPTVIYRLAFKAKLAVALETINLRPSYLDALS